MKKLDLKLLRDWAKNLPIKEEYKKDALGLAMRNWVNEYEPAYQENLLGGFVKFQERFKSWAEAHHPEWFGTE